jgi:beta-glucanase (GH16 family)
MAAPLLLLIALQTSLGGGQSRYTVDAPMIAPVTKPAWADEFNGNRLDPARWRFDTSRNRTGWFNHEKQYYGADYAKVANGVLTIEARRDPTLRRRGDWGGQLYGSAKLTTKGLAAWTYGFFEVRAKLPCGGGTWPAIWMMPEKKLPWPDGGEIDIMEQVSREPNVVHGTLHSAKFVHTKGTQRGAAVRVPTSCSDFHLYQLQWTPEAITIGVDGRAYFRVANDAPGDRGAWPFDGPFYLILNLALGGDWSGPVDAEALPQTMQVDYVRAWSQPADFAGARGQRLLRRVRRRAADGPSDRHKPRRA